MVLRHALPNALLPVITISGVLLGFVLGGSVAVEQAFGVPGLGRALVTAIIERDIIVVQNLVLLYALIFVGGQRRWSTSATRGSIRASATSSGRSMLARLLRQNWLCRRLGGMVAFLIVLVALAAPLVAPARSAQGRLPPHEQAPERGGLLRHRPGGRDALSRVIYGARTSLFVAFSAVLLGTTLGSLWGVACGYLGGRFDLDQPAGDGDLPVLPRPDPGHGDLDGHRHRAARGDRGHRDHPRALRRAGDPLGGAVSVSAMPFVEAGRAAGASQFRVMALHVLPQCVAPYLVLATTHLGVAIVIEAALGFLGVGVPPPTPTWGNMLADAITGLVPQWWLVFFPGLAITVTVLAFNLLGDGIRDSLDPKLAPTVLRLVTGVGRGARSAGTTTATPAPSAQGQPGAA